MLAYHFTADTLRDGRPIPAIGEWLVHEGKVEICATGLHASLDPFDALRYAPGPLLHLVECEDVVAEENDKFVCRRRKILQSVDATEPLWAMARWSALQVVHLWAAPPVVKQFLETGDPALRSTTKSAAEAAAAEAAEAAAMSAAWSAAEAAQRVEFKRRVDEAFA